VLLFIVAFLQQLMENWVLRKKKQGGCWKLKGDGRGVVPFLDFAQVFHKIDSIFGLLNTIS